MLIILALRFEGCRNYSPGTSATIDSQRLEYRVLGLHRSALVSLPGRVRIDAPKTCPEVGQA
jgi:hypothetical protein